VLSLLVFVPTASTAAVGGGTAAVITTNQLSVILEHMRNQRQGLGFLARQMTDLRNDVQRAHL
jgi:hypothetical protein